MILFEKEFQDLPGRDIELSLKEGEEKRVSISVTQDQIVGLRDAYGIDVIAMVEDAISNEAAQQISVFISKECFKSSGIILEGEKGLNNLLLNLKESGEGFIITNVVIGTHIQYQPDFELKPLKAFSNFGMIYEIGKLGGYSVYVDPFISYEDSKLSVVHNNFYNFEEIDKTVLITEGTKAPKIENKIKISKINSNSIVFNINNLSL